MKGILRFPPFYQVQCTDHQVTCPVCSQLYQIYASAMPPMQWLRLWQPPYLYFRYKTLECDFDFVVIEQLVIENVETDTGLSNVALLWPHML